MKVSSTTGKQAVLFDQEYSYALQSSPVDIDATTVIYESSPANAILRLTQMLELAQNAEWQRCGFFIQWREDGVSDPEDGWYVIRPSEISEELLFSGYAEPTLSVELRARQRNSVGIYVDSKLVPNDANLGGTSLSAIPMGFATQFPAATWTLPGSNGSILVVENAPSVLRATLSNPQTVMTQGRCRVSDQTANRSTQTEVFYKDHRNINGNWEISNDLVRYYFAEGQTPSIDVWDVNTAAWSNIGQYQLQVTNTGPVLPVQTVQLTTISPEEVVWVERRFDAAGTAYVAVTNRMRRGSRLIESTIVAASGAGLTGTQSIGIVNAPNVTWALAQSADGTGVAFTSSVLTADAFEAGTTTAAVFKSLGTDATGTITRWTTDAGAPGIAANILTMPAGAQMRTIGHQDWDDLALVQAQFVFSTNSQPYLLLHAPASNTWVRVRVDGTNLHLDKNIAGTATNDVTAQVAAALTNGTTYWLEGIVSGTGFTGKVLNDSANTPGTVIATIGSFAISDVAVQLGQVGLGNAGSASCTFASAHANVFQVQAAVPSYLGTPYTLQFLVGEPAFCWSKVNPSTGQRSLSIQIAVANDNGAWLGPSVTLTNGVTYFGTVQMRANAGSGNAQRFVMNNVVFDINPAYDNAWHQVNGSWLSTGNVGTTFRYIPAVAGVCYFDDMVIYQSAVVPGFAYLTANANAPTVSGQNLYSGATVPAGTITRIGILCGDADNQLIRKGTPALYAAAWASYNRQRIRQRIAVGLAA